MQAYRDPSLTDRLAGSKAQCGCHALPWRGARLYKKPPGKSPIAPPDFPSLFALDLLYQQTLVF
jgi:hypothetical protein